MCRILKPSIFAVLILILISGFALLIPPLIGLADNGDFERVIIPNGLRHEQQWNKNDFFGYFNHKYDKFQYYNSAKENIKSSQSLIIKFAMILDNIFTKDKKFDTRFLAVISLTVLSLSIYWFVEVIEKMVDNKYLKYFLALLAVIVFGDIGYTSYFNSFFGEGVAYPFYLLSISSLLKLSQDNEIKKRYLILFFISTCFFMGSKNQFSLNGILSFLLLATLLFFNIKNKKKVFAISIGVFLLGFSLLMYLIIDDNIYLINKYHMMTRGVMLFEPDVEGVTKEIGLDEQYALLAETIYFDRTPVIDPKDKILLNNFYPRYNVFSVTFYYLRNPRAFSKLLNFAWKNSFSIRPEVLGNYERSSGKDYGEKAKIFSLWSYLKENRLPHSSNFAYFFLLICLILAINRIIRYKDKGVLKIHYFSEIIMLYVFLTGFSQVLISFIGAGDADLKKHLFMTTVSLDILFFYNFAHLVSMLYRKHKIHKDDKKELL